MKMTATARRAAVLAFCAFIFYLSSRSEFPDIKPWYPGWLPDPSLIAHFCLYTALALTVWNDFRAEPAAWLSRRAPYFTVIFCILYGLSDEYHQMFVPNRHFDPNDLAIDAVGAAAAMVFIALLRRINKNRQKPIKET